MISDLAQHTRNLAIDARCSLLFDGTGGLEDPLAGKRLAVMGRLESAADEALRMRYAARHPATWLEFPDFRLYAMIVERAHLISGFGRTAWIAGEDLLFDADSALAGAEAGILAREGRAAESPAARFLDLPDGDWKMTGIDPEGIDLRKGRRTSRLDFDTPIRNPDEARAALARIAETAGARRIDRAV